MGSTDSYLSLSFKVNCGQWLFFALYFYKLRLVTISCRKLSVVLSHGLSQLASRKDCKPAILSHGLGVYLALPEFK